MPSLDEGAKFIELSNLVGRNGVKYFVEIEARGSIVGLDVAARLNLIPFIYDSQHAEALARVFPDADIFWDLDVMQFLRVVLPNLDAPAIIWGDVSPDERALIESMNGDIDWFLMPKTVQPPEKDIPGQNYSLGN